MTIPFKFASVVCVAFVGVCPAASLAQDVGEDISISPTLDQSKARDAQRIRPLPFNYPMRALREERQGVVSYRYTVSENGRVTQCTITQSSGHAILDEHACKTIVRYGRYSPALDGDGNPVSQTLSSTQRYSLGPYTE